jgi:1-acyl-sn-glycerol-3-phosphate acyltransferase
MIGRCNLFKCGAKGNIIGYPEDTISPEGREMMKKHTTCYRDLSAGV